MIDISTALASAGGLIGLWVIVSNGFHNWRIRQYAKRTAEAEERQARAMERWYEEG